MEVFLRCAVPDRPGALAELAGVIAGCGGDIEAVDVIEVTDAMALDDLVVVVGDPAHLRELLEALGALEEVEVVHASPSRGHPGDAVTRFAVGLESMLNGAMDLDRGLVTLLGGLLHADEVRFLAGDEAQVGRSEDLVLPIGARRIVLQRSFPFTRAERDRAHALVRLCMEAARPSDARA